jgi:hypothetical protein
MDEWIKQSLGDVAGTAAVDVGTLIISMALSFVLNLLLAKVYIKTHEGYSYSRTFVQAIVLIGITINLIMIVIGSNIARAFALVGAMSIVRFRNPIKDSRDLVFLFMAMAIGMTTGTQFYAFAIIFGLAAMAILLAFHHFGFGESGSTAFIMRVRMPEEDIGGIKDMSFEYCEKLAVISIDRTGEDSPTDVILEAHMRRGKSHQDFVAAITAWRPDVSVSVLVGESSVSV